MTGVTGDEATRGRWLPALGAAVLSLAVACGASGGTTSHHPAVTLPTVPAVTSPTTIVTAPSVTVPPTTRVVLPRAPRDAPAVQQGASVQDGSAVCNTGDNVAIGNASGTPPAVAGGDGGVNLGSASNHSTGTESITTGDCYARP